MPASQPRNLHCPVANRANGLVARPADDKPGVFGPRKSPGENMAESGLLSVARMQRACALVDSVRRVAIPPETLPPIAAARWERAATE